MRPRITKKQLQDRIDLLNEITGNPMTPYDTSSGKLVANVGNFHLSQAYGGYSLNEMSNESGGCYDTFRCGHVPARELYHRINALVEGIALGLESFKSIR